MFCDTSTRLPVKVFKTLNGRQSYNLSKFRNSQKILSSQPVRPVFLSVFFTQIQQQQKFIKVFSVTYLALPILLKKNN